MADDVCCSGVDAYPGSYHNIGHTKTCARVFVLSFGCQTRQRERPGLTMRGKKESEKEKVSVINTLGTDSTEKKERE